MKITMYEQHRLVETAGALGERGDRSLEPAPDFSIVIAAFQGVAMDEHDKAAFFGRLGPAKSIGDPAG
ncbi:MAG: hypothetical protein O3B74_05015 [Proteobacteria bacterium]|nr:hypothetical protein [Pseudomonadota bacterium]